MTDGKPNMRAMVREVVKSLGPTFTRADVYAAFPHLDRRTEVDPAFTSLCRKNLGDHCVRQIKREHVRCSDGSRRTVSFFEYFDPALPQSWPKELREVANRGGAANRIRAQVQHAPSGYAPGYFTELIRANNWPPSFESRLNVTRAPISMLQTVQRREADSATGKGWGGGACVMPGTPMQARPAFMGSLPGVAA